ncbi:hypothetical protein AAF143_14635 [Cyanobium sp. ATX-6F1]
MSEVVHCLEGENPPREATGRQTPEFEVLDSLAARLEQARLALLEGANLQQLLDQRDGLLQAQAMYFI